ncbi:MAG: T9SS type A sorting domain-containing protein [Chitinophagaceae bacterium]|nr:T9SS type A sorting domain-containing protein [Chitinophagaceae bacterium]
MRVSEQRPTIKPTTTDWQGQIYSLYPNPNDGNLTLVQLIQDTSVISIDISDVLGRSVLKEQVVFREKSHDLHLENITAGLYVVSTIDSKGRTFIFKFVKQ